MRLANSAARSPAKTSGCGCRRIPARPPARRRRPARRSPARQRPPRPTRSRCRPRQQRHLGGYRGACVAGPRVVRHELRDAVIAVELTAHPRAGRWPVRAGAHVAQEMATAGDDDPAADDDGVHVGGGARIEGLGRRRPSRTRGVELDRDQVSGCPAARRPPPCQPSCSWPAVVNAASSSLVSNRPRSPLARRSSISRARASSRRSMTACWSEPRLRGEPASRRARAGPIPSARSRSVVGQMQTPVPERPRRSTSRCAGGWRARLWSQARGRLRRRAAPRG